MGSPGESACTPLIQRDTQWLCLDSAVVGPIPYQGAIHLLNLATLAFYGVDGCTPDHESLGILSDDEGTGQSAVFEVALSIIFGLHEGDVGEISPERGCEIS